MFYDGLRLRTLNMQAMETATPQEADEIRETLARLLN